MGSREAGVRPLPRGCRPGARAARSIWSGPLTPRCVPDSLEAGPLPSAWRPRGQHHPEGWPCRASWGHPLGPGRASVPDGRDTALWPQPIVELTGSERLLPSTTVAHTATCAEPGVLGPTPFPNPPLPPSTGGPRGPGTAIQRSTGAGGRQPEMPQHWQSAIARRATHTPPPSQRGGAGPSPPSEDDSDRGRRAAGECARGQHEAPPSFTATRARREGSRRLAGP